MNIGIVSAAGRLGGTLVTRALDRGYQVTAIINKTPCRDPRPQVLQKSLFDLTREDVAGFDVLYSAFGSGFNAPPTVNCQAMNHLAGLVRGTDIHLIAIAGAGCLYADGTKTAHVYELPSHPDFLKEISHNTLLGVQDVEATPEVHYTFVCPGVCFDAQGTDAGRYLTSDSGCVLTNRDGHSYTTYGDLADAMLDFGANNQFDRQLVTVVSETGAPAPQGHQ